MWAVLVIPIIPMRQLQVTRSHQVNAISCVLDSFQQRARETLVLNMFICLKNYSLYYNVDPSVPVPVLLSNYNILSGPPGKKKHLKCHYQMPTAVKNVTVFY